MDDIAAIARGLTKAQRAFVCAASKNPKKWMSIRRHAKLHDAVRVHGMVLPYRLIRIDHRDGYRFCLTETGLAVRDYLKDQPHDQ